MNELTIFLGVGENINHHMVSEIDINSWKSSYKKLKFPENYFDLMLDCALPFSEDQLKTQAELITSLLANYHVDICTHSNLLFNLLRLEVAEGRIQHEQVIIIFYSRFNDRWMEDKISINEYGNLSYWPNNLFASEQAVMRKILSSALNKRRIKKSKKVD